MFTHGYPAFDPKYLNPQRPLNFSFLLHTYLVGATVIKKTVCYDSSPALHIAEARVIELSSGTSLAQFLMVFLTFEASYIFIDAIATCGASEKMYQAMLWSRLDCIPSFCSCHRRRLV